MIDVKHKRKCVELSAQGLTARQVFEQYYTKVYPGIDFETFRSYLKGWKKKTFADDGLLESANLSFQFTPHDSTVQINSEGNIIQAWIKQKADTSQYQELIDCIKETKKIDITLPTITEFDSTMLEIPLYDMHFGIADKEYYAETLKEVLSIIMLKTYEQINIIIGQDLFHNDDFRGRTSSGREIESVDMVQAWNDARWFYHSLIKASISHSKEVKVIYSMGNHDESMSWCFVELLKAEFDITVDDSLDERKTITYGDNFIGITHGSQSEKPSNLRGMFTIEFPIEFANAKIREIHAGHLHHEKQEDVYGVNVRTLSSGNPTDSWHKKNGYVGAHKRFTIFEWGLNKLRSIHYV